MVTLSELVYGRKGYRLRPHDEPLLEKVKAAADGVSKAQAELAQAIVTAHGADVPLRGISAAAGISHEQVRRIVRRGA